MTLKKKSAGIVAAALIVSMIAIACGGPTTADIVATSQAQNKIDNDLATREALIAEGKDPDNPQSVEVGENSLAKQAQENAKATATALAQLPPTPTPTPVVIDVPDGPTLTDADNPTVQIGDLGAFDPEVIKVQVGTTVTWENPRRSASSTASREGEAEQWDSGPMSKGTFATEPARFQHTFTIPGCHKYASLFSGDSGEGAVCVIE